MKFITFYTEDTIYEKGFKKLLEPSLKKFALPYYVIKIKDRGGWAKNTCQKPKIILDCLNLFDEDLCYIDSDAKIIKYPEKLFMIPKHFDIAVHYLSWENFYGRDSDKGKYELIDGTIWIKNNNKMKRFIKNWKEQTTDRELNHQKRLHKMLANKKTINVYDFGREYCYIINTSFGKKPAKKLKNPVIVHYQYSRKAKKGKLYG